MRQKYRALHVVFYSTETKRYKYNAPYKDNDRDTAFSLVKEHNAAAVPNCIRMNNFYARNRSAVGT